MAYAPDVLREAVEEADLLAHSEASMEQVAGVIRLAHDALLAGDGEVSDDDVRSWLHPTRWNRLGIQ